MGAREAANDTSELRSLLDACNEAKKTARLTIVRMLVTGPVMATLAGAFVKLKLFGGWAVSAIGQVPAPLGRSQSQRFMTNSRAPPSHIPSDSTSSL